LRGRRRWFALLLAAAAVAAAGWIGWRVWHDPRIPFLPPDPPARWIVYPLPPGADVFRRLPRKAVFRRTFSLDMVAARVQVRVRGYTDAALAVNGTRVELSGHPDPNWKLARACEIAPLLRPGPNDLTAIVNNTGGPPALWLSLDAAGGSLNTDGQWQVSLDGATPRPARAASDPPTEPGGGPVAGGERVPQAFVKCLPLLGCLAAAAVTVLGACASLRRRTDPEVLDRALSVPRVGVFVVAVYLILWWNNQQTLRGWIGYDADDHREYVAYVLNHGRLPLADAGWEMHQPPLFYALSAGILRVGGLAPGDEAAAVGLRLLFAGIAVAQTLLTYASLRILFPGQPLAALTGLLLAACLPMQLYMSAYLTNDLPAAAWSTAAIYLCLRFVRGGTSSVPRGLALGVCLGAALLTKLTAAPVAVTVLSTLAGTHAVRRESVGGWLRGFVIPLSACLAVCGWHFARVWARFGSPLVGTYDAASGFAWWQPPGYSTPTSYVRFRAALVEPFFSAVRGLPDGLYSTLWGDGMWGSMGQVRYRPPWNYDLMAAGYWLALVPTLLILIGLGCALTGLVRRPRVEWFLLVGLAVATAVAIGGHYLRLPYVAHAKAFYGLPAAAALCAFGARGLAALARISRVLGSLLAVGLLTWALAAFGSFWVRADAVPTQSWVGAAALVGHRPGAALAAFQAALRAEPTNLNARLGLAETLDRLGRSTEAAWEYQRTLEEHPDSAEACYRVALECSRDGRTEEAIPLLERVARLNPGHREAFFVLGSLLRRQGREDEAVTAFRMGLSVNPDAAPLHSSLAAALAARGTTAEATEQYRQALRLFPNSPEALLPLARLLATSPDSGIRNGAEAVRLAERGCALAGPDPQALDTLAAAFAEVGRFGEAAAAARRAAELARAAGQATLAASIDEHRRRYETGRPLREPHTSPMGEPGK
jgi:Flp pilus assembly protein TadD